MLSQRSVRPASPTEFPELSGRMEKCQVGWRSATSTSSGHVVGGTLHVRSSMCVLASCGAPWASGGQKQRHPQGKQHCGLAQGDSWASRLRGSTGVLSPTGRSQDTRALREWLGRFIHCQHWDWATTSHSGLSCQVWRRIQVCRVTYFHRCPFPPVWCQTSGQQTGKRAVRHEGSSTAAAGSPTPT